MTSHQHDTAGKPEASEVREALRSLHSHIVAECPYSIRLTLNGHNWQVIAPEVFTSPQGEQWAEWARLERLTPCIDPERHARPSSHGDHKVCGDQSCPGWNYMLLREFA